jgi:hypothetical protein
MLAEYLDSLDPAIREGMAELTKQELAAFQALDPQTATEADVIAIAESFHAQRNTLTAKGPTQ